MLRAQTLRKTKLLSGRSSKGLIASLSARRLSLFPGTIPGAAHGELIIAAEEIHPCPSNHVASVRAGHASHAGPSPIRMGCPPTIRLETLRSIAEGVSVIDDPRIDYVPNIGIVEGSRAILVVDTGMGPAIGRLLFS